MTKTSMKVLKIATLAALEIYMTCEYSKQKEHNALDEIVCEIYHTLKPQKELAK